MNKSFLELSKINFVLFVVIGACLPLVFFSSGCNFDPYKEATNLTDSATYNISGVITAKDTKKPINNISVFLHDTSNSIISPASKSDSNGNYTIKFPFIRSTSIFLCFDDIDDTLNNGVFLRDSIELIFKDVNYTYGYNKNFELTRKSP